MASSLAKIDFNDFTNAIPAFLTFAMMPLAYSIADGIIFGIRIKKKEKAGVWELAFLILSTIVGISMVYILDNISIIANTQVKILSFIPITISFCILFSYIVEWLQENSKTIKFKFLEKLGKYTLVIYCSHEILQHLIRAIITYYQLNISFLYNIYYYELTIGVITIIFSIIWSKIVDVVFYNKPI